MKGEIGRITVSRTLPQDLGHRQIDLYVDGTRVGSLANGDSLTHELPPGAHTLKVHNTLFGKSADFLVAPGEHVRFETANVSGPGSLMAFVLGAALMYLVLRRVATAEYQSTTGNDEVAAASVADAPQPATTQRRRRST